MRGGGGNFLGGDSYPSAYYETTKHFMVYYFGTRDLIYFWGTIFGQAWQECYTLSYYASSYPQHLVCNHISCVRKFRKHYGG